MEKEQLKEDLLYYFKKQYELGMLNTFEGNLSCRIEGSKNILITATSQEKEKMTTDMILEVDEDGNMVEDSPYMPSSELFMHLEIYKLRPDLNCVLHNHSTFATAFALAGRPISNEMAESFMFYGGDIPLAPYGRPGTPAVYKEFKKYFVDRDKDVILLANHGLVACAKKISIAFAKAEAIEKLAKITIMSEILGNNAPISAIEKASLIEMYNNRRNS